MCRIGGQFFYELEQNSQVRKLNIVTHVRSESQLDQLERLKSDQQCINTSSAQVCTRENSCWEVRMWWCVIGQSGNRAGDCARYIAGAKPRRPPSAIRAGKTA